MIIPKISDDFINIFFKHVKNFDKTNINKKNRKILKMFYDYLSKYEVNIQHLNNIDIHNLNIHGGNRKSVFRNFSFLNDSSIFLSDKIQKRLKREIKTLHHFKIKIGNIVYNINMFLLTEKKDLRKVREKVVRLLYLLSNFIMNKKVKSLDINLIFSDFKKRLPVSKKDVLDSFHINTGLTWACKEEGEILIYRDEEWYKVLIHELFHSLCLDFSSLKIDYTIKTKIREMFYIEDSLFSITETYCEFWANIIHTMIVVFTLTENFQEFVDHFEMFHTLEKYFSIFQTIKVLNHMKLDYNIITSRLKVNKEISSKNFKEKTNVFGYFILKLVWLYHLNEMLEYFSKTNKNNILDSNKSYGYVMSLLDKTKKLYKKKGMLSDIKKMTSLTNQLNMNMPSNMSLHGELMSSLRMSLIENK